MDRQSGPVQMESSPPIMQGLQHITSEPPAWARTAGSVIHYLMNDFGGGRRRLKLAWVINFQKLATIPLLATFIFKYQNFSPATWIYMAMQSSYGLVWIIKDLAFPDSSFQKSATIGAGIASLITVWGEDRWTLCGENHEVCCCTTREADHRRVRHCDHRIYRVMELSAYSCYP